MKRLISLLILVTAISACSLGEGPKSEFVVLPVESVTMPDTYFVDSVSVIKIKYRRPDNCHVFDGFNYKINGNTRTVAIDALKFNQNNCQQVVEDPFEVPLDFKPKVAGPYIFKFWLGTDVNGTDQYITKDVAVLP